VCEVALTSRDISPMNMYNQLLDTMEAVEFEKQLVEVQDFMKFTDHFGGICRTYLNFVEEKLKEEHNM
jgi:hypothetical protein